MGPVRRRRPIKSNSKQKMETPNGLEDWEVVTPSSGGDETDAGENKNGSGLAHSQEKTLCCALVQCSSTQLTNAL